MQAIIETGGKQYRVAPGDVIKVETLPAEAGSQVEFKTLAVFNDDGSLGAGTVTGSIVGEGRARKVLVFKFKRKKQYKKTQGHRQNFTKVKVEGIA